MRKGAFVPAMHIARAQARLGDVDGTIEWLGKALHERSRPVLSCRWILYSIDSVAIRDSIPSARRCQTGGFVKPQPVTLLLARSSP